MEVLLYKKNTRAVQNTGDDEGTGHQQNVQYQRVVQRICGRQDRRNLTANWGTASTIPSIKTLNSRNGHSNKTMKTGFDGADIDVPCDPKENMSHSL